jgi:hypothetical protein
LILWSGYGDFITPKEDIEKNASEYKEKKLKEANTKANSNEYKNEELTSRTDKSPNSPTIKPDGDYSSGAYNSNCKKYALSRKECAVAANYSQCMELKGSNSAYVNLCSDDGKIR